MDSRDAQHEKHSSLCVWSLCRNQYSDKTFFRGQEVHWDCMHSGADHGLDRKCLKCLCQEYRGREIRHVEEQ